MNVLFVLVYCWSAIASLDFATDPYNPFLFRLLAAINASAAIIYMAAQLASCMC